VTALAVRRFEIGRLYFMVTYQDQDLCRPIVLSYEYLGRDMGGLPVESSDSGHYFKYLPGIGVPSSDESEPEFAEVPHFFTEQQLSTMLDIDGLVAELGDVRDRLSKRRT
jgi:hypothetical protein